MPLLSIVVPCYNEQDVLPLFVEELSRVVRSWHNPESDLSRTPPPGDIPEVEAIFVDDGSIDGTLEILQELTEEPARNLPFCVRWISFSRNFGKEAGLLAGLKAARGDFVATMDADMQDPPSLLPSLYLQLVTSEYDNIATRRVTRTGEPPIRSACARLFYRIISHISQTEIVDGARDFRLMRRSMVDAIISMPEYNRFSKGIFGWVGFKTKWIAFENVERSAGETHWSFWSLLLYAIDGIVAFSTAPLSIASIAGVLLCFVAFVALAFILVRTLLFGDPVDGWPSLVCIIVFLGGIQLLCLGIMGQYLAKTYLETKRRPLYIIREQSPDPQEGER